VNRVFKSCSDLRAAFGNRQPEEMQRQRSTPGSCRLSKAQDGRRNAVVWFDPDAPGPSTSAGAENAATPPSKAAVLWEVPVEALGRSQPVTRQYTADGGKHYLMRGQPLFPAYSVLDEKADKQEYVGSGTYHDVFRRRNPLATVFVKRPKEPRADAGLHTERLDELAALLSTPENREQAVHFALELNVIDREGQMKTLTRKVTGPTLWSYFNEPNEWAAKVSVDTLPDQLRALEGAVHWLNEQGFRHQDIKEDNVMIDLATGKLVLIDFGSMDRNVGRTHADQEKFDKLEGYVYRKTEEVGSACRQYFAAASRLAAQAPLKP
jgi:hypothetical protein